MAKSGLVWDGLAEYLDELRRLPEECQAEAAKAIEGGVNAAYVTISGVYGAHRFTGNLQKGLRIKQQKGGLVLVSGAPHAALFDGGSQARHWKRNGKYVGRMPPTHIFKGTTEKTRRYLAEGFKAMLLRRGAASVTDDAR